jgi:tRNA-splicing ligase RtcB
MTRSQREALFLDGLLGLLDSVPRQQTEGLWSLFHEMDLERDLSRVEQNGSLHAERVFGLDDFMGDPDRLSRDSQIGSIGGGNHFVEIQRVERILDGSTAHAWGLKVGMVTVMVHTGSVSIGHLCGGYYRDVVRDIYPKDLKHPGNGIFALPLGARHQQEASRFWDALHNAANFAFANRLFLALMALASLREAVGEVDFSLLYDAPTTSSGAASTKAKTCSSTARAPARRAGRSICRRHRSPTTASRCWCPARWARRASFWRGRAGRKLCGVPATARAALCRAATRRRVTTRSSRSSSKRFAW